MPAVVAVTLALSSTGLAWLIAGLATATAGFTVWTARLQRRRAGRLLADARQRENYLRTIITSEPACVKTVSRDLKLLSMNPAGLALIEADSMEQVQGADLRDVVHPEHLDEFIALNDRVFAGESVSARFRIVGLHGTVRWMESCAAPLLDGDGSVVAHLAVTNDVSERVAMDQRLIEARDAAIAGTRAKSAFLANMSHEIRTPMTAILGWVDVLEENVDPKDEAGDRLAIIRRSGEHLLSIVDDLLDLSRIEAGKAAIVHEPLDPAAMVRDVRVGLLPRISGRPVELRAVAGDDVPGAVISDPTRLRQILINLCGNALKFTEEGSVTLRVGVEECASDRSLVFEVEDTGPGIEPEQLERVMNAFEQVDDSASRRHGGVGLGLAISRSIAHLLGGSLGLTSEVGKGTVARLRLPLVEAELGAAARPDAASASPEESPRVSVDALHGCRVLLAEDGRENRRLLMHLLERVGCEVVVATDGRAAVDRVIAAPDDDGTFDVILMDVQMPLLDGHSATRELRLAGVRTPVVALTAHAMIGDRERALEAGCDGYLTKPLRAAALYAELTRHLGTAAGRGDGLTDAGV